MTHPPLLLAAALLFWGWQSHLLAFAVPMLLILEATPWVKWRWNFADKDFRRVVDFTSVILILTLLYLFNQYSSHGLMKLVNWFPVLFFLLITVQIYSTDGTIKLGNLLLSLRRYEKKVGKPHPKANLPINFAYPYFILCLLSASINNSVWFYAGISVLLAWGLWAMRPKRYHFSVFALLLLMAISVGYVTQLGIYRLHSEIEELVLSWLDDILWANQDPYRRNTAIGDIRKLKQSDKIRLRVEASQPLLLQEASYNVLINRTWIAKKTYFKEIMPSDSWLISTDKIKGDFTATISAYLNNGKGMLALPNGTFKLSKLAMLHLYYNNLGAVKVEYGPDLIRYTAHFANKTPLNTPPNEYDLLVPKKEKSYLIELYNDLRLSSQTPAIVVQTLTEFFEKNFKYSLNLTGASLEDFLQIKRAGHCEYFATATVLLLRTAGIPSRYASGYAAIEWDFWENAYLVRQRHAHAWALAYINGRWQAVDTTVADWADIEAESAAWWTPVSDIGSWIFYQFSKWRWSEEEDSENEWLLWLILPLVLILIWRLYSKERVKNSQKQISLKISNKVGADSPFFQIVQALKTAGYVRQQGETLTVWLKRIQLLDIEMQNMLTLHQRYRFDSVGLNIEEQASLTRQVQMWLEGFKQ
jgi:hypothetical protein